jgi:FMN phosphatase YigB (HAD superfamily)
VVPNNEILSKFDAIYNSYNYGSLKNDNKGEMFREIANYHGIGLASVCLVEDQQAICKTFENLGGNTIQIEAVENTAKALNRLI